MFKIEKGLKVVPKADQRSEFTKELEATMKAMESGDSFVIPINRIQNFYKLRLTWHNPDTFYSNKISETEVRIFKR